MGEKADRTPLTDLLFHGLHPFPAPVERLVLRIHKAAPQAWHELQGPSEGWAKLRADDSCRRVVDYLTRIAKDLDAV